MLHLGNATPELLTFIVDRINTGVFVVNSEMEIQLWNNFMASHSGKNVDEVLGKNIFEVFPELPQRWLKKKIDSVFILKNFAFTSWEQRPYLFEFKHNRPITGGVEYMNQDFTLMPIKDENGEVESVCVTLQDATDVSIYQTMLKDAMTKLESLSRIDGLTQLNNRAHWEQRLSEEFERVVRYGDTMSLILFDLDFFKKINDNYGHLAGDQVLRDVSDIIRSGLRENDIAGRYGGEEFGIILPATDAEGASVVAERLRQKVAEKPVEFEGTGIPVTVSLGIVQFNEKASNHEQLIAQADEALYKCKENGRNQWQIFTSE